MQLYTQQNYGQTGWGGSPYYQAPNIPPVSYQGGNSYFQTPTSYNQSYNYPYNYGMQGTSGGCGNCYSYGYPYNYVYGGYPYQGAQKKDCGCGCGGHGNCGQYGLNFDRITPQYPRKLGHSFVTSGSNKFQNKGVSHDHVSETAPFQSQRRVTYQPYTRKYFDYEEYIQYIPVQKSYWDYQKVTKQTDFIPKEYYQSKIQYVPQEKLTQKVRYIPIQQQIVHVPQQTLLPKKTNVSNVQNVAVRTQQIIRQNAVIGKPAEYRQTLITNNSLNSGIKPAISTVQMVPRYQLNNQNYKIHSNIRPNIQARLIHNQQRQLRKIQDSNVNHSFNRNNQMNSSFGVKLNEQFKTTTIQNRRTVNEQNMSESGVRVVESKFSQQDFQPIRHQQRFVRQQIEREREFQPTFNHRQSQASLVNQISREQNFR